AVAELQSSEIFVADEHGVARRAGQRIDDALDHRVELPAAPGGDAAYPRHRSGACAVRGVAGASDLGIGLGELGPYPREVCLAVGRRELSVRVECAPAPLSLIALCVQPLDSSVERHRARDFLAN